MRRKLTGLVLGAIVALAGFAAAGFSTGIAATADTTTATTTGTTGTTDTTATTGTTTGSTTTASTTTGTTTTASTTTGSTTTATTVPARTVTATVTVVRRVVISTRVPLCHRVGTARRHVYVLVKVLPGAVNAHLRSGDKPVTRRGNCAALNRRR
jgi:cytoskeletal protein RodZ